MGKGKRVKSQRKIKTLSENEIYSNFSGENLEEFTDELYEELLSKGFKEYDLKFFQKQGFHYCMSRNSFVDTPQFIRR